MKSHISLEGCPFCGSRIEIVKGPGNVTFFRCNNLDCLAVISFGGNKKVSSGITKAENPIKNFNRRSTIVRHGKNITEMNPVDEFVCSECGFVTRDFSGYDEEEDVFYEFRVKYCPKCGVKMEEEI